MNTTGDLIQLFAESGYLIDQAALSYVKQHDHKEIIELFDNLNPDILVISLPEIRKVHKTKRNNYVVRYVDCFKPDPGRSLKT